MGKDTKKKLHIRREVLKEISDDRLKHVAGGEGSVNTKLGGSVCKITM